MLKKNFLLVATLTSAAIFATAANAAAPGFYLGGQAGWGSTHYDVSDAKDVTSASIDDTGVAGRIFTGYQFDQNWAVELGYTQFSNTKFSKIQPGDVSGHINEHAIDVVGKGILPLQNNFNAFADVGAAYVRASNSGSLSESANKINPTFGFGVGYDITPNVPVFVAWNHIQKLGGKIPNTDLFSAGIAYNFG